MSTRKFLTVLIEEELHRKLKIKLTAKGMTISKWLRQKIDEEINS